MTDLAVPSIQRAVDHAYEIEGIAWSICVRRPEGERCAFADDHRALPTASVGKILLLAETARRLEDDPGLGQVELSRDVSPPVGEAGLWQQLTVESLALIDVVALVATLSDNLAMNVLLAHIGLPAVESLARELGLEQTALLDRVRSEREPGDPPHLSIGSAGELSGLAAAIDRDALLSPKVSQQLRGWLAGNADLSMVLSVFGLDPLAHRQPSQGVAAWNKTGSDAGTAADVGAVRVGEQGLSYAAIAHWSSERPELHDVALRELGSIGAAIRSFVHRG